MPCLSVKNCYVCNTGGWSKNDGPRSCIKCRDCTNVVHTCCANLAHHPDTSSHDFVCRKCSPPAAPQRSSRRFAAQPAAAAAATPTTPLAATTPPAITPPPAAAAAAAQQPDTADLETTYKAYLVADVLAKVGAGNFKGAASSKRKLDAILAEAA